MRPRVAKLSMTGAVFSMDLKRQQIDAFTVAGLRVRTTNAAEHQAATAKIGPMWGQFFSEEQVESIPGKIAWLSDLWRVFGVRVRCLGGVRCHRGCCGECAGKRLRSGADRSGRVPGVRSAKGTLPEAVIATWGRIWTFFEANPQIQRRYATDFEAYTGPESVSVHIGIR